MEEGRQWKDMTEDEGADAARLSSGATKGTNTQLPGSVPFIPSASEAQQAAEKWFFQDAQKCPCLCRGFGRQADAAARRRKGRGVASRRLRSDFCHAREMVSGPEGVGTNKERLFATPPRR